MQSKLKLLLIIVATIIAIMFFVFPHFKGRGSLINPDFKAPKQQNFETPQPNPTPKTFRFDSSTDLKMELDSINPQVLDSDFR